MRALLLGGMLVLGTVPGHTLGYQIVTEEWAPYSYIEAGRISGILTDIVRAIMTINQVDYPISILPSMRLTTVLNTEPQTIMYSLFRTKEREPKYQWVGPVLEESIYPYRLKGGSRVETTLDELKSAGEITTRQDGLVPRLLVTEGFQNLEMRATESPQLYKMLFSGRAAMIIGDTDLGVRYYLKKLNLDATAVERVPVEIFRSELYIVFSLDSEASVVEAWRQALNQLKKTGVLKAILAKYDEPTAR